MYTLAKGISPTIMENIFRFPKNGRYNLRSQNTFQSPFRDFIYNGTESISYSPPSSPPLPRLPAQKNPLLICDRQPENRYLIDQFERTNK